MKKYEVLDKRQLAEKYPLRKFLIYGGNPLSNDYYMEMIDGPILRICNENRLGLLKAIVIDDQHKISKFKSIIKKSSEIIPDKVDMELGIKDQVKEITDLYKSILEMKSLRAGGIGG